MLLNPEEGIETFSQFNFEIEPVSELEIQHRRELIVRHHKRRLVNLSRYPELSPYFGKDSGKLVPVMAEELRKSLQKFANSKYKYNGIDNARLRKTFNEVGGHEAITLALNYIAPSGRIDESAALNYIRLIKNKTKLDKGEYGETYSACLQCRDKNTDIIIKILRGEPGPEFVVEAFIGFIYINRITRLCPNFITTYGFNQCHDIECDYKSIHINTLILEKVNGQKLYDMKLSESQLINILVQLLLSLQIAYDVCQYTHYDLHADNVMIERLDHPKYLFYYFGDYTIEILTDVKAKIIDYGLSSVENRFGTYDRRDIGILPQANPTYDVVRILKDLHRKYNYLWIRDLISKVIPNFDLRNPYVFPALYDVDYKYWLGALADSVSSDITILINREQDGVMWEKLKDVLADYKYGIQPKHLVQDLISYPEPTPMTLLYFFKEYDKGATNLKSDIDEMVKRVNYKLEISKVNKELSRLSSQARKIKFSPGERSTKLYKDRNNLHLYKFKDVDKEFEDRLRKFAEIESDMKLTRVRLRRLRRLERYIRHWNS